MSATTAALTRNETIVNLTAPLYSAFSSLRHASRSVMSASSLWVTWGIITQLRARFAAEIFWIRERAVRSTGPNFSKSTRGHGSRSRPAGAPPARGRRAGPARLAAGAAPLASPRTSSGVSLPLRPLPVAPRRSTPSSRASRRTEGLA